MLGVLQNKFEIKRPIPFFIQYYVDLMEAYKRIADVTDFQHKNNLH